MGGHADLSTFQLVSSLFHHWLSFCSDLQSQMRKAPFVASGTGDRGKMKPSRAFLISHQRSKKNERQWWKKGIQKLESWEIYLSPPVQFNLLRIPIVLDLQSRTTSRCSCSGSRPMQWENYGRSSDTSVQDFLFFVASSAAELVTT
jgi:hypothetical protein